MASGRGGDPGRRLSPQLTVTDDWNLRGSSPRSPVPGTMQSLVPSATRSRSRTPAPMPSTMRYLEPGRARTDGSSRGSSSRSTSAQRLPGVRNVPIIRKVLSLDGGGVRGLSTIIILKHIMGILNRKRGFDVDPWQEFDMIGGTSTGGLLAIMLGRLRMSIDECEQKYLEMSQRIFTRARGTGNVVGRGYDFLMANGRFSSGPLKETIQEILADLGLPANSLLKDEDADSCKVFVCATQAENSSTVVIRSFQTDQYDGLVSSVTISEAARATSAASTFFDPVTIGQYDQKFVDGALKHNNPINLVDLESSEVWRQQDRIIISIGTGSAPGEDLLGNLKDLAKKLAKIVTDTEEENELFRRKHQGMIDNQRLYRFNVLQGLSDVGLEEYDPKAKARIASHTDHYLRRSDTQRDVAACCQTLAEGAQRLSYVGGQDLTDHLDRLALSDVMCAVCDHCLKGIPYNQTHYICHACAPTIVVCERCHAEHDRQHHESFVSCTSVAWAARGMPELTAARQCDHCSQMRRDRVECPACRASLCLRCWGDEERRAPWIRQHRERDARHRQLSVVYPTHHFLRSEYRAECECIDDLAALCHCDRCFRPIRAGETVYHCRDCDINFSCSQEICETCLFSDLAEHPSEHAFYSILIERDLSLTFDLAQPVNEMFKCGEPDCKQAILPGEMSYHPHALIRSIIGPFAYEAMHSAAVRDCPRSRLRRHFPQSENASNAVCLFCKKFIPFWNGKILSLCIQSGCFKGFCDFCTEAGRQNHRHPLVNCAFIKRPLGVDTRKLICDTCRKEYWYNLFIGMRCASCQNWDICIECLKKGIMPRGHGGSCSGVEWLFFRAA